MAALVFIPILLASIAALWWLTGKLSRMQIFVALVVIFFGGLTAWFNDEAFFKMKTTIVYGTFATILGVGLLRGQSYLQWVMGEMMPLAPEGWMILTRRLTLGFAALAIANEIVWRTQTTELWVKLETFAFPAALFLFLMLQIGALSRHMIDPDQTPDRAPDRAPAGTTRRAADRRVRAGPGKCPRRGTVPPHRRPIRVA